MGFFDDVNGSTSAPIIKLAEGEMTRIRVIPAPEHTKYAKAKKCFQHSPPREQELLFGGYCSVRCMGERNGCIFHEDPYKWKASLKVPINVIEYEVDKTARLTGNRFVKLWIIGPRVLEGMTMQLAMNGISQDDVSNYDLLLKRTGQKQTTSYAVSISPTTVEAQIDYNLPPIGDYGDAEYPFLIDYEKLYGFEDMTAAEQQVWLAERIQKGREKASSPDDQSGVPFTPSTLSTTPLTNAGAPGGQFALGSVPTFGSAIGADMPRVTNYAAIEAKPDPWGQGRTFGSLEAHELQYIIDVPGHSAEAVKDATALINKPVAAPPPPPPAPVATPMAPPPAPVATPMAPPPAPLPPGPPQPAMPAPFPTGPVAAHQASSPVPATVTLPNLPAPPAAAAPAALPAPTLSAVNPKRMQVETLLQQTPLFANFENVMRFLGAWNLKSVAEATEEQFDSMIGALAMEATQLAAWVAQFPVPAR